MTPIHQPTGNKFNHRFPLLAIGLCLAFLALITLHAAVRAEEAAVTAGLTLIVDRTDDVEPPKKGCDPVEPNDCSLRGAIMTANAAPGLDIIELSCKSYDLAIAPSPPFEAESGDLNIADNVSIAVKTTFACLAVKQATVRGVEGFTNRIFRIENGAQVTMNGLNIRNGNVTGGSGGGIFVANSSALTLTNSNVISNSAASGGGIFNGGVVMLVNSTLSGNQASEKGGGISNNGVMSLTQSSVVSNTAQGTGGGVFNENKLYLNKVEISHNQATIDNAGGLYNEGVALLSSVTISQNLASKGAGIYNHAGGHLTLLDGSRVLSNTASEYGGGILNSGEGEGNAAGQVEISASQVSNNLAQTSGGGIVNAGVLTITLATIHDNQVLNGIAGAIFNSGSMTISRTQLFDNQAHDGGALFNLGQVYLAASAIAYGQAVESGGGIYNEQSGLMVAENLGVAFNQAISGGAIYNKGQISMTHSSFGNNYARRGAGVYSVGGALIVHNSTLALNHAFEDGGGLYLAEGLPDSSAPILNFVTVVNNTADYDQSGIGDGGGIFAQAPISLSNTLIGNNSDFGNQAPDCAGPLVALGYNLIEMTQGCTIDGATTGNLLGVDPQIGMPIQMVDATGSPRVIAALNKNSPALNAASLDCLADDQLGRARPIGGRCDIGALEAPFLPQTITFAHLPDKQTPAPAFVVSATASSNLTVNLSAMGVCTLNVHTVTLNGQSGYCEIAATQPGDDLYLPAQPVVRSFAVVDPAKKSQTISFAPLLNKTFGTADFAITATASSNLPISFTSLTQSICTISDNMVTLLDTDLCTIRASQVGNGEFNPAANVEQSFVVVDPAKQNQILTFDPLSDKQVGDAPAILNATSNLGLPVEFVSLTPTICMVVDNKVTAVAVGLCTIQASQPGNATTNPAQPVERSFQVLVAGSPPGGSIKAVYLPLINR